MGSVVTGRARVLKREWVGLASAPRTGLVLLGAFPSDGLNRVRAQGRLLGSLALALAAESLEEKSHRRKTTPILQPSCQLRGAVGGAEQTPVCREFRDERLAPTHRVARHSVTGRDLSYLPALSPPLGASSTVSALGSPLSASYRPRLMTPRNDANTTLGTIKAEVLAFAQARDWEQFHSPKNLSMAISAEAAELMEPLLWATPEESRAIVQRTDKRPALQDELADIVIYCLQFANQANIDLASAIAAKMERNGQKYPVEKAKGRSTKYNEL